MPVNVVAACCVDFEEFPAWQANVYFQIAVIDTANFTTAIAICMLHFLACEACHTVWHNPVKYLDWLSFTK